MSRPTPPMMISTISSPESCQLNMVGLTKRLRSAKSAPASPVIAPEMTKATSFSRIGFSPMASTRAGRSAGRR